MKKHKPTCPATLSDHKNSFIYDTVPVGIEEFLRQDEFLGGFTQRGKALSASQFHFLKQLGLSDQLGFVVIGGACQDHVYDMLVCWLAYCLYRVECFKASKECFNLPNERDLGMAFFSPQQSLLNCRIFWHLRSALSTSPWFQQRIISGKNADHIVLESSDLRRIQVASHVKINSCINTGAAFGVIDSADFVNIGYNERGFALASCEKFALYLKRGFAEGNGVGQLVILDTGRRDMDAILSVAEAAGAITEDITALSASEVSFQPSSNYGPYLRIVDSKPAGPATNYNKYRDILRKVARA
jgi:hypothetical protein